MRKRMHCSECSPHRTVAFFRFESRWECVACGHSVPAGDRATKPRLTPTAAQQRVIDAFSDLGWTVAYEFDGQSATVTCTRDGDYSAGRICTGTVGAKGRLCLTLTRLAGQVRIADFRQISEFCA